MKRRVFTLMTVFCLFFCLAPVQRAAAASDVCFIATNDKLKELSSSAYIQRSTVYVPYNVFEYFRVYNSYSSSASTASLYTSAKQIFFNISSGNTYDNTGQYYSTSAILHGGQVYVSVDFVCRQFGLTWSYIDGIGHGDVCRIMDGNAILSDSQFLAAATSVMQKWYEAYVSGTPKPGGETAESPPPEETEGCDVYLSFQGMPSDKLLDTLKQKKVSACFFVTADEVRSAPDTVRRIVGEGHNIGVLCSSDPVSEYDETAKLIFEAARVNTLLVASATPEDTDACKKAAAENGLVFWDYGIDGVRGGKGMTYASYVTSYLSFYHDRADVRILCCDATDACIASVLSYIITNNFNLKTPCEVGNNP